MFDIFDVLSLIGGLCLFLFGMNVMGDGLERRAGNSLKSLLGRLTNSRMAGFLTGLGVTAVIQSSSATTVMVVGFVNSKVMTLKQSIGVVLDEACFPEVITPKELGKIMGYAYKNWDQAQYEAFVQELKPAQAQEPVLAS